MTTTTIQVDDIARVCHEANRAMQINQADPTIPVSPSWDELDAETRASATDGVVAILDDGVTPEGSHENWCRFKREHGWVLGPVKDETKKEHPLLVPYSELPAAQRTKDALFHAIVTTLAVQGNLTTKTTDPRGIGSRWHRTRGG